jgi:flagellar biosynthesis protein FliQ
MRDKNSEKKAVWFAIPVYVAALLINILVGLGVSVYLDPAVVAFLDSLMKSKG